MDIHTHTWSDFGAKIQNLMYKTKQIYTVNQSVMYKSIYFILILICVTSTLALKTVDGDFIAYIA
jgi:hypothetical protein